MRTIAARSAAYSRITAQCAFLLSIRHNIPNHLKLPRSAPPAIHPLTYSDPAQGQANGRPLADVWGCSLAIILEPLAH